MQQIVTYNAHADVGEARRLTLLENLLQNTICETREFALNLSTKDFVESVSSILYENKPETSIRLFSTLQGCYTLVASANSEVVSLVQINVGGRGRYSDISRHNFTVIVTGEPTFVLTFLNDLHAKYGDARLATVTWWYKHGADSDYRTVPMEPPLDLYDEFYPWLDGGVANYIAKFLDDRASLLFMMGPPGTGKTSLLRHMIYHNHLAATVTYEESLLGTDEMFVNFLCEQEDGILVVEDADLMVQSRESEGNKLISRFLNVSDGLIKTAGKKIVFTTNLGDFKHVDEALVRSGRCFDAVRFRALTYEEACNVMGRMGLLKPTERKEYTLAELLGTKSGRAIQLAKVGF